MPKTSFFISPLFIRTFLVVLIGVFLTNSANFGESLKSINLEQAALERTTHAVTYDGRYLSIAYPMGDVPDDIGVCTDVVIRSYRALGIDLQQLVHEDMRENFSQYPTIWGLSKPDTNIDHRRVPNLATYLTRKGAALAISDNAADYLAGDLVTWVLPGNLPHIGIVISEKTKNAERPLIIHNVGAGTLKQDFLFTYPISGHYRFASQ